MKDIAIFGAGGLGREVACLINMINGQGPTWNLIGFFDDNPALKGTRNAYGEVLGGCQELNAWSRPLALAIAIGNPQAIKQVTSSIHNSLIDFPNLTAPSTIFLDRASVTFGKGNIICSRCLVSCNVSLGDFNILDGYITIGHDVKMGNCNAVMPSVNISGNVTMGDYNFLGVKSVVLQELRIGNDVRLGAGCLMMQHAKDGLLYVGIPAKEKKH